MMHPQQPCALVSVRGKSLFRKWLLELDCPFAWGCMGAVVARRMSLAPAAFLRRPSVYYVDFEEDEDDD